MTPALRHALNDWKKSRDADSAASAEEAVEFALQEWHEAGLKEVVKKCIRIASELQGTGQSIVDVLVSEFDAVL